MYQFYVSVKVRLDRSLDLILHLALGRSCIPSVSHSLYSYMKLTRDNQPALFVNDLRRHELIHIQLPKTFSNSIMRSILFDVAVGDFLVLKVSEDVQFNPKNLALSVNGRR